MPRQVGDLIESHPRVEAQHENLALFVRHGVEGGGQALGGVASGGLRRGTGLIARYHLVEPRDSRHAARRAAFRRAMVIRQAANAILDDPAEPA